MTSTVSGIAFALLSIATVGGAIGMLATRNVVHAAFWLLEVSIAAAGLFFLLEADYVALIQLLVYAVAVAVLMLFSIMLTLRRIEDAVRTRDTSIAGILLALAFAGLVIFAITRFVAPPVRMPAAPPDLVAFGTRLFSAKGWALQFEIASLILTAALVGAVWWTKGE